MKKYMTVKMPDNTVWAVPTQVISLDRAAYFASEFDGDIEKSLAEDTLLLFEQDEYQIADWAAQNMNWNDVEEHAFKVESGEEANYQYGWLNGEKGFSDEMEGASQ